MTPEWQKVSASRVRAARDNRAANVTVHGEEIVAGLEDFYDAVDALWQGGALSGLKILAR